MRTGGGKRGMDTFGWGGRTFGSMVITGLDVPQTRGRRAGSFTNVAHVFRCRFGGHGMMWRRPENVLTAVTKKGDGGHQINGWRPRYPTRQPFCVPRYPRFSQLKSIICRQSMAVTAIEASQGYQTTAKTLNYLTCRTFP